MSVDWLAEYIHMYKGYEYHPDFQKLIRMK